ncbi:MAG TPA: AAA family ATPase [Actinomycetaceae bacterium]|nr:AAA family ATPase [Actinomycetaceae bacterium]
MSIPAYHQDDHDLPEAELLERETTPLAAQLEEDLRQARALKGVSYRKPRTQRVITVSNQKGGVGKTTSSVNIAAALAKGGLKVLLIDQDPQGNASTALGIEHAAGQPSVYDVLIGERELAEIIRPCADIDGLYGAPATIDLAGAEIELVAEEGREYRLREAVRQFITTPEGASYDYIIIDCPPSLGLLTLNAFVAAKEVLIPIQCEYYALEGLSMLLQNVDRIRAVMNPDLHVSAILLTMYDKRTNLSRQVAEEVRKYFPEQTLATTIPRSVRISEAPSHGQTVITYDPMSAGAIAYRTAAREIADRGAALKEAVNG